MAARYSNRRTCTPLRTLPQEVSILDLHIVEGGLVPELFDALFDERQDARPRRLVHRLRDAVPRMRAGRRQSIGSARLTMLFPTLSLMCLMRAFMKGLLATS